ncbi:two-component system, sensor histidine kinase YesM [Evansella caseinilytica]|uniref:histidine kinase n=1 Tax=Evansella caseinilytica TaxID=1503961 RepID=A0A1H3S067_9BACI|nr:sensor histidine kinase [Evansella caseinilytica]SDZ31376.1 two-component system, sensor histidine kinase YesM [Evansella caseinilytica]
MIKKIVTFYSNLRIKYKMFLLISFVLVLFSIGGVSILQYAFHVYNDEIYRQSAQSLSISSTSIENEIKNMERLSYSVATDMYVHTYLTLLKNSESAYERYVIGDDLRKRLLVLGALDKYVDSLQIYDLQDKEYASGNRIVLFDKERLQSIKDQTVTEQGGLLRVYPIEADAAMIVARDVRSYATLSLERLGTAVVRFSLDEIVSNFSNSLDDKNAQLVIFNDDNQQIYPQDSESASLSAEFFKEGMEEMNGYQLVKADGERFFVTYSKANHTNWTYMIITPYSSLFQAITFAKRAVTIIYAVMFLFIIFLAMRFIGGVTSPIESLNRKMEQVQSGELKDFGDYAEDVPFSLDEAGQMHHNFKRMMEQIDYLISENYKKQLVIKDAEFKTLQAQVNPHFLYNTLESINWAAKVGGHRQISSMAESLGYILRSSINMKEALIPLEEELRIVNNYITIQAYRFEERLAFSVDIPPEILANKVPKFILQPLVENAIHYGLQQKLGTCTITVTGKAAGSQLVITVTDDGPGMEGNFVRKLTEGEYQSRGTGIGIKNIHERVKILFGEQYGLRVESERNKGTKVQITLPYEGGNDNVQGAVGR